MLTALRSASAETTLAFLWFFGGCLGSNSHFAFDSTSQQQLPLWGQTPQSAERNGTRRNPTRRCAKQEAAEIDAFLLNPQTAAAATPSPLIFYQALHYPNPSKLSLPPLITFPLLAISVCALSYLLSWGGRLTKMEFSFPSNKEWRTCQSEWKKIGQNLRKEGCRWNIESDSCISE